MRVSLLTLLLATCPSAWAEEELPEGFFEFLGAMVERDGEWIDPLSLTIEDHLGPDPFEEELSSATSDSAAATSDSAAATSDSAAATSESAVETSRNAAGKSETAETSAASDQPDTIRSESASADQVTHTEAEGHD